MPSAGDIIKALDFPAAVAAVEDTLGTTTSTTYTSTLTGGTACAVVVTAQVRITPDQRGSYGL